MCSLTTLLQTTAFTIRVPCGGNPAPRSPACAFQSFPGAVRRNAPLSRQAPRGGVCAVAAGRVPVSWGPTRRWISAIVPLGPLEF